MYAITRFPRFRVLFGVLIASAIGPGCNKSERAEAGEKVIAAERKVGAGTEGAIELVKEIGGGVKETLHEGKQAAVVRASIALAGLDADYRVVETKYENAGANAKAAWAGFKVDLNNKRSAARQRLADLKDAATGDWHPLSDEVDKSVENMRVVLKAASEHALEQ